MLTTSLPTNAASSFETSLSRLPLATLPLSIGRRAERSHVERAARSQVHPPHRVAGNTVQPIVEISPPDSVERQTASWPGMTAEIVQVTRSDRIESRFCAPVHLLAVYEPGRRGRNVRRGPVNLDAARLQAKARLRAGRSHVPRLAGTADSDPRALFLFRSSRACDQCGPERDRTAVSTAALLRG